MNLTVNGQEIIVTDGMLLVSGSIGIYEAQFEFSEDWTGFAKTAVFANAFGQRYEIVLQNDACVIPHEVLADRNNALHDPLFIRIGVYGVKDEMIMPTAWTPALEVVNGAGQGEAHVDPTPTQWEQVLADLAAIDTDVRLLRERVDEYSIAVGVVGTYAELSNYDTSTLSENDIVKVLADETHSNKSTYYKWTGSAFSYLGMIDTGYTKTEADALFEVYASKVQHMTDDADEYPSTAAVTEALGLLVEKEDVASVGSNTQGVYFDASGKAQPVTGALPVSRGGTGATSAAAARTELEAVGTGDIIDISHGGLGSTSVASALEALGLGIRQMDVAVSNITGTGTKVVHLTRFGNFVHASFDIYGGVAAANTSYKLCNFPTGYRPVREEIESYVIISGSSPVGSGSYFIMANGDLYITGNQPTAANRQATLVYYTNDACPT